MTWSTSLAKQTLSVSWMLDRRLPCPVCLGAHLSRLEIVRGRPPFLDRCGRCGGIWFDHGEVDALRSLQAETTLMRIVLEATALRMKCHDCSASLERNAERCHVCGWRNVLSCPQCEKNMRRADHEGLVLDVCSSCHGVWFDQIELAEIWNAKLRHLVTAQSGADSKLDFDLLTVLWHVDPELLIQGARFVGRGGKVLVESVAQSPALAMAAVEGAGTVIKATGELAGDVFSAIADIIGAVAG